MVAKAFEISTFVRGICRNFRFSDVLIATVISWIVTTLTLNTIPNTLIIPEFEGAPNPTYSYPLRFGAHLCSLKVIEDCIRGFNKGDIDGHDLCCSIIHDKDEEPSETVADWSLVLLTLWIPLFLLVLRGFLWRKITMFQLNQRSSKMVAYPSLSLRASRSHSSFEPLIRSAWDPSIGSSGSNELTHADQSLNSLEGGGFALPADGASDRLLEQPMQNVKTDEVSQLSGRYVDVTTFIFWSAFVWEGVSGCLVSSAYQAILCIVFKWYVGEPRPIYYALKAWASIYPVERYHLGRSSHMSFPSGHSSTATGSLIYVALLLAFDALQLQRSLAAGVWSSSSSSSPSSTAEPMGITLNVPSQFMPLGSDDMADETGSNSKSSPTTAQHRRAASFAGSSPALPVLKYSLLPACLRGGGGGSCTWINITVRVMAHISILLVGLAVWIGATRIRDYWHFPHDVLGKRFFGCDLYACFG